jgi:hypothetical protein
VSIINDEWNLTMTAERTYGDGTETPDQTVSIGWETQATHGWDRNIDIDLPTLVDLPTGPVAPPEAEIPGGSFFSRGFSTGHKALTRDIRPFGRTATWYLFLDFGINPTSVSLSWPVPDLPRSDLPMYLVEVDEENDFSIIPDTEIDMLMTTELNFDTEILTEERIRVFRITIGSASASVTVSLQPGWNLVSFPITPNDSDPDAVFSNHTGRVITGVVWGYRDGSYFAAENIVAATGYWVYNARDGIEHIVVSGFTGDNKIVLKESWNLVGTTELTPQPMENTDLDQAFYYDAANRVYIDAKPADTVIFEASRGYWVESNRERQFRFR